MKVMEKKTYIQPEIEVISMTMDCVLSAISANEIINPDGSSEGTIGNGGESGNEGDLFGSGAPAFFPEEE